MNAGEVIEGVLVDQNVQGAQNVSTPGSPRRGGKAPGHNLPTTQDAHYAAALVSSRVAFHGARLPLYWLRLAVRAPLGLLRLLGRLLAWVTDAEGRHVRAAVARGSDAVGGVVEASSFTRVQAVHRETIRERAQLAGIVAAAWFVALGIAWALAPLWWWFVAAVVVLPVLGWHGRREGQAVTSRPVHASAAPVLSSSVILDALGSLGIAELNKGLKGDGVRFVSPIHRDGPGWRADIDLPAGVTAGDVIERRDRLASGLRRPEGAVWPEAVPDEHAGRLLLYVADRATSRSRPAPWPLAARGSVNLFDPVPLGVDPRGRDVSVTLMFVSVVIGAIPRMGKTFAARVLTLAAALDPRCELHVVDFKGGADWLPLEGVAHFHRVGDDDDDVRAAVDDLRALSVAMRDRYATLRGLPRE